MQQKSLRWKTDGKHIQHILWKKIWGAIYQKSRKMQLWIYDST